MRRQAVERIERQSDLHVAAMYSNTNMDDPQNNRDKRVTEVQEFYREVIRTILDGGSNKPPPAPDPQAEAFMRAGNRSRAMTAAPEMPGEAVFGKLR